MKRIYIYIYIYIYTGPPPRNLNIVVVDHTRSGARVLRYLKVSETKPRWSITIIFMTKYVTDAVHGDVIKYVDRSLRIGELVW